MNRVSHSIRCWLGGVGPYLLLSCKAVSVLVPMSFSQTAAAGESPGGKPLPAPTALAADAEVALQLVEAIDLPAQAQKDFVCQVGASAKETKTAPSACMIVSKNLAKVQTQLIAHYSLPGDITTQPDRPRPVGWIDPEFDPQRSLFVGAPVRLKRRDGELVLPVFLVPELVFFQGSSANISKLNTAIDYWSNGKADAALGVLDELVEAVKAQPAGDHERMAIYLVRASLHLDFFVRKLMGDDTGERSAESWKGRARADFEQGILEPSPFSYVNTVEDSFDAYTYLKLFDNGVYVSPNVPQPIRPKSVLRAKRSLAPLVWIRSVAPAALFNLMSLTRVRGQFAKSFSAAERLEEVAELMKRQLDPHSLSVATVSSHNTIPSIGKPRYLRPAHISDAVAITHLMRAAAQSRDAVPSIMEADEAVRKARSPSLAGVGFALIADVFFDRHNDLWAKRIYAWSELMDPLQTESFPDSVLWGAEAALWRGHFGRSEIAFKGLRDSLSDPVFGADVDLRLLQFDLFNHAHVSAATRMEYLRTHYSPTHVAADVIVLDFCANAASMTRRARAVEYERVGEAIKSARLELREQARACLLHADLRVAEEDSKNSKTSQAPKDPKGIRVANDAQRQAELIEAYRKDFPDSPYLALFQQRDDLLKLGPVFSQLEKNDCKQVLAFYTQNEEALWATSKLADQPVSGLKWTTAEMNKVIRCSAFENNVSLWERLRRRAGSDDDAIREATFLWRKSRTETQLIALRDVLVNQSGWKVFDEKQAALDSLSAATLADASFWVVLGVLEVLTNEPVSAESAFFDAPLAAVTTERETASVLLNSQLCSWSQKAITSAKALSRQRLKMFLDSAWLESVTTKGSLKLGAPAACLTRLSAKMINRSSETPELETDQLVLWPYVEKIGPMLAPELAFALAKRSFERGGEASEAIVGVYSAIAKGAKDEALQRAAKSWLKVNVNKQRPGVW